MQSERALEWARESREIFLRREMLVADCRNLLNSRWREERKQRSAELEKRLTQLLKEIREEFPVPCSWNDTHTEGDCTCKDFSNIW